MKGAWGKIKSLGKFIDSSIDPIYILLIAYLTLLTLLLIVQGYNYKIDYALLKSYISFK